MKTPIPLFTAQAQVRAPGHGEILLSSEDTEEFLKWIHNEYPFNPYGTNVSIVQNPDTKTCKVNWWLGTSD